MGVSNPSYFITIKNEKIWKIQLKDWIWMLVMPHGFPSPAAATTASTIRGSTYASAGPAKELANVALTDHMIY